MPTFVDGYVLCLPTKNLKAYTKMARTGAKLWLEHGALEVRESVGADLAPGFGLPFPKLAGTKKGETVVFSYITFKSKAHRNKVNAAVMKDPRLMGMCDPKKMPFDCARMAYGGFTSIVGK
ncbi:MAG: DUF1428 domain-containing protein [Phycisphaerales bacterium]